MSALGDYLKQIREERGLGLRETCRLVEQKQGLTGREISSPYLSQVETGYAEEDKVSIDFLWAVGVVLRIDPLKLFVLSRANIDQRCLDPVFRRKLWKDG